MRSCRGRVGLQASDREEFDTTSQEVHKLGPKRLLLMRSICKGTLLLSVHCTLVLVPGGASLVS